MGPEVSVFAGRNAVRARARVAYAWLGVALVGCLPRASVRDAGPRDAAGDAADAAPVDDVRVDAADAAPVDDVHVDAAETSISDAADGSNGSDALAFDVGPFDAGVDAIAPTADTPAADARDASDVVTDVPPPLDVTGTLTLSVVSVPRCVPAIAPVELRIAVMGGLAGTSMRVSTEFGPESGISRASRDVPIASGTEGTVVSLWLSANGDGVERRGVVGAVVADTGTDSGRVTVMLDVEHCRNTPDVRFQRPGSDAPGDRGLLLIPRLAPAADGPRHAWVTALGFEPGGTRLLVSGIGLSTGPDWATMAETNNPQLLFARFSPDGTPDPTLGIAANPGLVTHDLTPGGKEMYWSMIPLAGGGALIGGDVYAPGASGLESDQSVVRLTSAGLVDAQGVEPGYGTRNVPGFRTGVARLPPANPLGPMGDPPFDDNDSTFALATRGADVLVGGSWQSSNAVPFGTHVGTWRAVDRLGDPAGSAKTIAPVSTTMPTIVTNRSAVVRSLVVDARGVVFAAGEMDAGQEPRIPSRAFVVRFVPDAMAPGGYSEDRAFVGDSVSRLGAERTDGVLTLASPMVHPTAGNSPSNAITAMYLDPAAIGGPALVVGGYVKADGIATFVPWIARLDARTGGARQWSGLRSHTFVYRCGYPSSVLPADSRTTGAFRALLPRAGGGFFAAGYCSSDRTVTPTDRNVARDRGAATLVVSFDASGLPTPGFGNEGEDWPGALHFSAGRVLGAGVVTFDQAFDLALDASGRLFIAGTLQSPTVARGFLLRLWPGT